MSGHGFHVHGPHDHEIEHATQGHAEHGGSHTNSIAMFTAVIATVGAIFSYMGGATQANAGLFKNNAAIKKTEASNQWNYYQAKSSKQNLSELAIELAPPAKKDFYQDEIKRYKSEKAIIQINKPISFQIDGEFYGKETNLDVQIKTRKLKVTMLKV